MKSFLAFFLAATFVVYTSAFGFTGQKLNAGVAVAQSGKGQMEMRSRVCDLLGKEANRKARAVCFSHKRAHKVQHVNLQWKRYESEELGRKVKLRLSTKGIKTVNKYGSIDAAAKKFGVDLSKF